MAVKEGDFIKLSFTGRLEDGTLFDTTEAQVAKDEKVFNEKIVYRPVLLIIGKQQAIKGLDEAAIGMTVGQEKDVVIAPEKAFGQRKSELISVVPAAQFDKDKLSPFPGMIVNINNREGMVKSVGAGRVIVDFNHPLAGRNLKYHLKLVELLDTSAKKVKALFDDTGLTGTVSLENDTVLVNTKADPTESYIFKKQTFLSWMREIAEVKKIKFNEEYELYKKSDKGSKSDEENQGHSHEGHTHEASASVEKQEQKSKSSKPKKQ